MFVWENLKKPIKDKAKKPGPEVAENDQDRYNRVYLATLGFLRHFLAHYRASKLKDEVVSNLPERCLDWINFVFTGTLKPDANSESVTKLFAVFIGKKANEFYEVHARKQDWIPRHLLSFVNFTTDDWLVMNQLEESSTDKEHFTEPEKVSVDVRTAVSNGLKVYFNERLESKGSSVDFGLML